MKKLLVAATVTLIGFTQVAHAQQGTLLAGGNIGIATSKSPSTPNDSKQSSFVFNPTVGYQFDDNFTVGAVAEVASNKSTNALNVENKSSNFGIGPFVRYTKTLSNTFAVYGQLQGIFATSKTNGTKTNSSATIGLFPAVFVNVKNGFGLNFSFGGIGYESVKPVNGRASTAFGVSFGQSANIGISKNFSFKKK